MVPVEPVTGEAAGEASNGEDGEEGGDSLELGSPRENEVAGKELILYYHQAVASADEVPFSTRRRCSIRWDPSVDDQTGSPIPGVRKNRGASKCKHILVPLLQHVLT